MTEALPRREYQYSGIERPARVVVRTPYDATFRLTLVAHPEHSYRPYEIFVESRRFSVFWQFENCRTFKSSLEAWRFFVSHLNELWMGAPGYD